jgi:uncharacterized membrane protein YfcA
MLDFMHLIILAVAVFLGGVVSGFAGFAFSAVAGAILLHFFDPLLAIPLMMTCSVISQTVTLFALRTSFSLRGATPFLLAGVLGLPPAIYLLTFLNPHAFRVFFGLLLAAYAAYSLTRTARTVLTTDARLSRCAVGFLGGFVGGLTAMPGATVAIWCELRGLPKNDQRALVQPFILVMQILGLGLLFWRKGEVPQDFMTAVLAALPALAAGTFLGTSLFGRSSDKAFRTGVLVLLFTSGCGMLA